jgi:YHS domain-containing protein
MKTLFSLLPVVALMAFGTIAHAGTPYPLQTCVVSGEKLDDMGKPVVINYKGTEVHFCCNHCVSKFNADPAKYLAKLKAAQAVAK